MEQVSYGRSIWAALLTLAGNGSVTFSDGRWSLRDGPRTQSVEACAVTTVRVRPGLFWSTLELVAAQGVYRFRGLAHRAAEHLHGAFTVAPIPPRVNDALSTWSDLTGRRRYLNHYAWATWREHQATTRVLLNGADLRWLPAEERTRASTFAEIFDRTEEVTARLNKAHVETELQACKSLLDAVETNPLTARQRVAVITDEDNTLVVAGAGTGKTSVVVAKVAYVVQRLGIRPAEVLLLAYNKAAAAEIQERVKARVGVDLTASTFHALGMGIIGRAEGARPTISRLAERSEEPGAFIEKAIRAMLSLGQWRDVLVRHLVEYLRPFRPPDEFTDKHAYIRWLKGADIRSMKGDQVRSLEECVIADWLFLHGIEYEYERDYEHNLASPEHRQYRPDFYLVGSGVYIEHFGVDRNGKTAPWIDAASYRSGMEWKRATHRRYRTRLVETFSYDRQEGKLTERLAERLAAVGVVAQARPAEEIEAAADQRSVISLLAKLVTTFLQHFKEGRRTLGELRAVEPPADPHRTRSFLAVFEHIYQVYEAALREEKAIDFQDMIGRAADLVESGRFRSPYRYIIVDEFQDTSRGRARLLSALLDQMPDRRLTCVGDDWQSIYRFAGSDIAHMTRFQDHFGYTASVDLDESFRFGRRLLQVSARFVQKNPAQLRKTLSSPREEGRPAVVVLPISKAPADADGGAVRATVQDIRGILARIAAEVREEATASVYLLGRYNFSLRGAELSTLSDGFPRLKIEFLTVHRAKGLQADYVIIVEANSGRFGFPSEIADDPLLSLVLAEPDAHEHAEERRLFYVALTRARHRVFILTRDTQRSTFVEELLGQEYAGLVEGPPDWADRVVCPDCKGSLVRRANSKTGAPFWGCVDYPYCEGSARVCAVCQEGALVLQGMVYQCSRKGCAGREEVCPQCRDGMLVKRQNRTKGTEFWGCSKWKHDRTGCNYTRDVVLGGSRSGSRGRR